MRIRLQDLKIVAKQTFDDERLRSSLVEDVARVVGPVVETERRSLEQICEDVLFVTEGVRLSNTFRGVLLGRLAEHRLATARRVAARFLETDRLTKMLNDVDPGVVYEAAARAPVGDVVDLARRNRRDDHLRSILESRLSREKTLLNEEVDPQSRREIERREPDADDVLDDFWYDEMASKIISTYGNTYDTVWVRPAVEQYASSITLMMGTPVDAKKLLSVVSEKLEDRDDAYIDGQRALGLTLEALRIKAVHEDFSLDVEGGPDAVETFISESRGIVESIETCQKLFNIVCETTIPRRIRTALLIEGIEPPTENVPSHGTLPTNLIRECDEIALDRYVAAWNRRHAPLKLDWTSVANGTVRFDLSARIV